MNKILTAILLVSFFAGAILPAVADNNVDQNNLAEIDQAAANVGPIIGSATNVQAASICQGNIADQLQAGIVGGDINSIVNKAICKN